MINEFIFLIEYKSLKIYEIADSIWKSIKLGTDLISLRGFFFYFAQIGSRFRAGWVEEAQ